MCVHACVECRYSVHTNEHCSAFDPTDTKAVSSTMYANVPLWKLLFSEDGTCSTQIRVAHFGKFF